MSAAAPRPPSVAHAHAAAARRADAAPIILAPTAHIIVSMAQHSHALRKPLFAGALIASLGAIAQRLYLMKDSWAIKECGSDAEDEY